MTQKGENSRAIILAVNQFYGRSSNLRENPEAFRVRVGGCGVHRAPPPRVPGVETGDLLAVEQILKEVGVVPQSGNVKEPKWV